jgi:hypothetical protein
MLIAAAVVLTATQASAQSIEEIRKYDRNGNDRIDKGKELDVYLLHKASPVLAKYDDNRDGVIDSKEALKITDDARKSSLGGLTGAARDEVIADLGDRPGIPVEELADKVTEPAKSSGGPRLYIRRDKTDISVASRPIAVPDAKGARISYSRDGITDEEIWTLDAVASLAFVNGRVTDKINPHGINLTGYALVPWVETRRRTSTKPGASQTDKLAFGVDSEFQLFGGPIALQYVTLGLAYQTDRVFDASIFDGYIRWTPFIDQLKIGTWYTLIPNLQVTWLTALDSTFRSVESAGTYTSMPAREYWWAGGWVKGLARYWLDDKRAIVFTGQYDYRRDLNSSRVAELFSAELAFPIDPQGNASVSVEYKHGRDWATFDKFDLITTGLNFKL